MSSLLRGLTRLNLWLCVETLDLYARHRRWEKMQPPEVSSSETPSSGGSADGGKQQAVASGSEPESVSSNQNSEDGGKQQAAAPGSEPKPDSSDQDSEDGGKQQAVASDLESEPVSSNQNGEGSAFWDAWTQGDVNFLNGPDGLNSSQGQTKEKAVSNESNEHGHSRDQHDNKTAVNGSDQSNDSAEKPTNANDTVDDGSDDDTHKEDQPPPRNDQSPPHNDQDDWVASARKNNNQQNGPQSRKKLRALATKLQLERFRGIFKPGGDLNRLDDYSAAAKYMSNVIKENTKKKERRLAKAARYKEFRNLKIRGETLPTSPLKSCWNNEDADETEDDDEDFYDEGEEEYRYESEDVLNDRSKKRRRTNGWGVVSPVGLNLYGPEETGNGETEGDNVQMGERGDSSEQGLEHHDQNQIPADGEVDRLSIIAAAALRL